jgi:phosphoribosylanthranilate isomerase
VKICGIRTIEAARAACDAGADALGFVFHQASPRCVTPDEAARIVSQLPPLVTTVALFVNADPDVVNSVLLRCAFDCLQFHGDEDAAYCEQFRRPYLRAVSMRPDVDVDAEVARHPNARAFLLDTWRPGMTGGTGETFEWDRIPPMNRPWCLAGGLNADSVGRAIRTTGAPAVDVSGGVESARGTKDPQRIREFIAAVRSADRASGREGTGDPAGPGEGLRRPSGRRETMETQP